MSRSIDGIPSGGVGALTPAERAADGAPAAQHPKEESKAHTVGREFEAIFVRTILRAGNIGGSGGSSGAYADMGVDGLAKSITSGRGLGLAEVIEEALSRYETHPAAAAETTEKNFLKS